MGDTKIADVIVPELFTPYVLNKTAEKSALWQSGIVGVAPLTTQLINGGKILQTL